MKKTLKQQFLDRVKHDVNFHEKDTLSMLVSTPANKQEIIIVVGKDDILEKIKYIQSAYNDDLVHNNNKDVKIVNYDTYFNYYKDTEDYFLDNFADVD